MCELLRLKQAVSPLMNYAIKVGKAEMIAELALWRNIRRAVANIHYYPGSIVGQN